MGEGADNGDLHRAATTSWYRPTPTPRLTASSTSSPTSIPLHREEVAAFGDMSALAISMFGGFDPGEVDESDPVRATAARRLAGMGVDVDAAQGWLAHYGTDWVIPGDGDGRRLAVLEEQGIHAEVTLPGPILAGGLSPAMYLGGHSDKRLEVVWPALHALRALARRLLRRRAGPPGRLHADRLPRHGPRRRGGGMGASTTASMAASCCRPCRWVPGCRAMPTSTTSRSGACAKSTRWSSPSTPARRAPPLIPSFSTTRSTAGCSASTRCSSSPVVPCGS